MKGTTSRSPYHDHFVKAEFAPIVNRLSKIIRKQFNCELSYIPLMDRAIPNFELIHASLGKGKPIRFGETIYFPVFLDGHLAGAADISDQGDLKPSDIQRLHKVIRTVLESGLASLNRLEVLAQLEEHLKLMDQPGNLIQLREYRALVEQSEKKLEKPRRDRRFGIPILIVGPDVRDIHKMALELHGHSNRFAFIKDSDLDPEVTRDISKLRGLGPLTLFIPELESLDEWQQETLMEYYSGFRNQDGPQVVAGSRLSYKELIESTKIDSKLVRALSVAYLKMDKPFKQFGHDKFVDFFFESLTSQSLEDRI